MSDIKQTQVSEIDDDAVILDVREQDEWDAGHAANAVHVPLGEVPQNLEKITELAGGGPVRVTCRRGGRSQQAAEWLAQNGVEVENVAGGMTAWAEQGKRIVSDKGEATII